VCVSLSVCLLVDHLDGGLVEQSDNDVCLFVCLCVLDTSFRWWSYTAVGRRCLSVYVPVCLSASLCLVRDLGCGPVERSDSAVCVSVCLYVPRSSFRWWFCAVSVQWCVSVCLSVYVCVVHHLGGGPVQLSDSGVCLPVCVCAWYIILVVVW